MEHRHKGTFFAAIKKNEIMTFVGGKMVATGSHYVKQNKPDSKRQIPCVFFLLQKLNLKGCVCIAKLEKRS